MKTSRRFWTGFLSLLAACVISACSGIDLPDDQAGRWQYTDVRLLDPLQDSPTPPDLDLTVVYAKYSADSLEFRLEILDLSEVQSGDIYLLLDVVPGGAESALQQPAFPEPLLPGTDIVVRFAADGQHQGWYSRDHRPLPGPQLRISRNPTLDLIDLHLTVGDLKFAPALAKAQVLLTRTGQEEIVDASPVFSLSGRPPPQAAVFLAFWDVYDGKTPAQALRRWDGAHSGPFGERHGLNPLLESIRAYPVPVLLLDLLQPSTLSELDFINGLGKVQRFSHLHTLTLSNSLPVLSGSSPGSQDFAARWLQDNQQAAQAAALSACDCVFLPNAAALGAMPPQSKTVFVRWTEANAGQQLLQSSYWRQHSVVWLPDPPLAALERSGLSLAGRSAVLQTALHSPAGGEPTAVLFLGGSLPQSGWGDPQAGRAALEYLTVRPWVRFLSVPELSNQAHAPSHMGFTNNVELAVPGFLSTRIVPPGEAWAAVRTLLQPPLPQLADWTGLQAAYRWVPELLSWVQQQAAREPPPVGCELEIPGLDDPLCVLANENILAIVEPQKLGLLYLGRRYPRVDGYAQIVGPSAQLAIGLSDPTRWQPQAGPLADPDVIPAAFSAPHAPSAVELDHRGLTLDSPQFRIVYQLVERGLEVAVSCPSATVCDLPAVQEIPLLITPEARFQPGWAEQYIVHLDPPQGRLQVGWRDGAQLTVYSSAALRVDSFRDSPASDLRLEDPDMEFPAGHFLPLGFSRLAVSMPENGVLRLRFEIEFAQLSTAEE